MWFGLFIVGCLFYLGYEIWKDPNFQEKLKNLEE